MKLTRTTYRRQWKCGSQRSRPPWKSCVRIPLRMRRPSAASEALGFSPPMQACWAHASSVEGVPLMTAGAEPTVPFAGRPAAQRTADARAGRIVALVLIRLVINYNSGLVIREGTHASILIMTQFRIELCGRKSLHFCGRSFVHPFR
jgi:hypothetical protein